MSGLLWLAALGKLFPQRTSRARSEMEFVLRPQVGEELFGQGQVTDHVQLVDSTGKFYGLCRLTVERTGPGYPQIEVWGEMLPVGSIRYGVEDKDHPGRIHIWYKLPGY